MTSLPESDVFLKAWPDIFALHASKKKWINYRHIKWLAEQVTLPIMAGNARIVISMPPRHGKSEFLSKWLPIWYLEMNPEKRIIIASYAAELAETFGRRIRDEMTENDWIKTKLKDNSQAAHRFDTKDGGGLIAAGVGGSITGKGAHLFIIDDPYKDKIQAFSPGYRKNLVEWYETVARTRLEPGGSMVLIMTRWHEDDLAANFIKTRGFQEIRLPAIAEENDPLGRKVGEALCPERYDLDALADIRGNPEKGIEGIGSYAWNSLYQQKPIPIEGGLFKRKWWKRYRELPHIIRKIQIWDCAQKPGITNDYSVCATWGLASDGWYLIDLWRNKVEAPQLYDAAESLYRAHTPNEVVIEDKASGIGLIQFLQQKTAIPVIAYDPGIADKEVRATSATPMVEAGKCSLPIDAPWVEEFIIEHERFPNDSHDDQVDTTSILSSRVSRGRAEPRARSLG